MTAVKAVSQSLNQDAKILLLTIDLSSVGGSIERFCTSVDDPGDTVTFNSLTYFPRQFSLKGFGASASGAQTRPTLKIDNVDRYWWSRIVTSPELKYADVTYKEVYRQHLDDGSAPDATQAITTQDYIVRQMSKITPVEIELKLKNATDAEDAKIGRQMLRDTCNRSYRTPDPDTADLFFDVATNPTQITCPYVGGSYFTRDGTVSATWTDDACGQRFSDCALRFPSQVLPIQAFQAIGSPRA